MKWMFVGTYPKGVELWAFECGEVAVGCGHVIVIRVGRGAVINVRCRRILWHSSEGGELPLKATGEGFELIESAVTLPRAVAPRHRRHLPATSGHQGRLCVELGLLNLTLWSLTWWCGAGVPGTGHSAGVER